MAPTWGRGAYTDTDVHTGEGLRPYGHMRPYGVWTEDV
jgi:hypothetical protein